MGSPIFLVVIRQLLTCATLKWFDDTLAHWYTVRIGQNWSLCPFVFTLSLSELIEFLHGVSKERTSLDRRSTIEQEGPESWYIQRPRPDIYSDRALVSISISCLTLVNLKFQHAPVFFFMDLLLFFFFDVSFFFWSCNLIDYGSSFFCNPHKDLTKFYHFPYFIPDKQNIIHSR